MDHRLIIFDTSVTIAYTMRSTATIVGPAGVDITQERKMPTTVQIAEQMAEQTTMLLKFLNNRMDVSDGKMMSAEIRRAPTSFIASTIITAVTNANNVL